MPDTWSDPRVWVALEKLTATKMNELSTLLRVLFPFDATGYQIAHTNADGDALVALNKPSTRARLTTNASGDYVWQPDVIHFSNALNASIGLTTSEQCYFSIPSDYAGFDVVKFSGFKSAGTGTVTLKLRNVTQAVEVLSTNLTISSNNTVSSNAVINTANDAVAAGDIMLVSVVGAGTNSFDVNFTVEFKNP